MNALAKTGFLVFFLSLCATAGFLSHDFRQRMVPAPAPRELYSIVNNQLAAFRADDFPRAYQHAAANVHQKFSLAQFETLIRNDYATMTHAERVEFGMVRVEGATAVVQVLFCSPDGTIHLFSTALWRKITLENRRSRNHNILPPGHHFPGCTSKSGDQAGTVTRRIFATSARGWM